MRRANDVFSHCEGSDNEGNSRGRASESGLGSGPSEEKKRTNTCETVLHRRGAWHSILEGREGGTVENRVQSKMRKKGGQKAASESRPLRTPRHSMSATPPNQLDISPSCCGLLGLPLPDHRRQKSYQVVICPIERVERGKGLLSQGWREKGCCCACRSFPTT